MKFVKPKFFREWNDIRKEGGLKLLLKQKGPIVLVVFFSILSYPRFNIIYFDTSAHC